MVVVEICIWKGGLGLLLKISIKLEKNYGNRKICFLIINELCIYEILILLWKL